MTPETIESKIKQGLEKINNEKTKSIKELNDLKATLSSQLTDTTEILNQSLRGVGEGEQRILKTNYQNRIKDLNTGVKDAKARIAEKEKSYIASITSSAKEIETKSNSTEKRLKTLLTTVDSKIEILNKDLSDLTTVESKIESLHEEIKTLKKNTEISISESVKKVETSLIEMQSLHKSIANKVQEKQQKIHEKKSDLTISAQWQRYCLNEKTFLQVAVGPTLTLSKENNSTYKPKLSFVIEFTLSGNTPKIAFLKKNKRNWDCALLVKHEQIIYTLEGRKGEYMANELSYKVNKEATLGLGLYRDKENLSAYPFASFTLQKASDSTSTLSQNNNQFFESQITGKMPFTDAFPIMKNGTKINSIKDDRVPSPKHGMKIDHLKDDAIYSSLLGGIKSLKEIGADQQNATFTNSVKERGQPTMSSLLPVAPADLKAFEKNVNFFHISNFFSASFFLASSALFFYSVLSSFRVKKTDKK